MAESPSDDQWINDMLASALSKAPEGPDSGIPLVDVPPPEHRTLDPVVETPAAANVPAEDTFTRTTAAGAATPDPVVRATTPSQPTAAEPGLVDASVADFPAPSIEPASSAAFAPTGVLDTPIPDALVDDLPDDEAVAAADDELPPESNAVRSIIEWIVVLVGAVAVALLLRAFLFQAFWIPSESMETTLLKQDRVLVNKLSYRLHDVNRGDVVVFRRPDDEQAEIRDLIKRVIGLPGETVSARDNTIFINDQPLIEPYLAADEVIEDFGPTLVPDGEVFVMGDNRDRSLDSRFFGTVEEERIVGRAFVLFWPLNRIDSL